MERRRRELYAIELCNVLEERERTRTELLQCIVKGDPLESFLRVRAFLVKLIS